MASWQIELAAALGPIARVKPVSGGDINDAWRVDLVDERRVFVKTHEAPPAGMYAAEASGLGWLQTGPLRVPQVIASSNTFLALEWLEIDDELGGSRERIDQQLGRGLAALHRIGAHGFGLDGPSFLATIPQDNAPAPDVVTFWIERRLRPLCRRLRRTDLQALLDVLATKPDRFGPPEPPARLHGDLWWGNVVTVGGAPVLIDPAVYAGHREIDLAMLRLFGGVTDELIAAYDEVYPLAPAWRERIPLWQLYPLLAHAVLFGGGYAAQATQILVDLT